MERAEHLIVGLIRMLGYTAILAVLLLAVKRGFDALDGRLQAWSDSSGGLRFQDVVLLDSEHAANLARLSLRILRFGLVLFLLYLYFPIMLSSIPATEQFAHRVMPHVLESLSGFGRAIVGYLPNLIRLILILVVVTWALRLFKIFMDAVGSGDIALGSFNPVWADQTYRLVHLLVLIFTVVLIYPLLPGSDSPIFKGVSVFAGALLAFGGRGSVDSLVAGVILTYSPTFEVGDRVRIGSTLGDVVERGSFVTSLQTVDNEVVAIPNSVVLQSAIVNLSEASSLGGLKIRIPIGIGYETEWQQVYELLVGAAKKTNNVRHDPEPSVLQTSLDDYSVTYTLVAALDNPRKSRATRSELSENIQDAFNEAGLEIMTPSVQAIRNSLDPVIPAKYDAEAGRETRFRVDPDSAKT